MNFIIGTGYHERSQAERDFANLWYDSLWKYTPPWQRIVVISTGADFPVKSGDIDLIHGVNLGHIGDHDRKQPLCGCSCSYIALASIAYNCGADLVYREQDVISVGPWLEKAYEDMCDRDCVFGPAMKTAPHMPCALGIFIVRNRFLLEFIQRYLGLPSKIMLTEHRFHTMEEQDPDRFAKLSYGVDRERPIPWDAPVWYAQKLTGAELREAKSRGIV